MCFELETSVLAGHLQVDDLPEALAAKVQDLFGITPLSTAQGVLPDVHWSTGSLGYFPTQDLIRRVTGEPLNPKYFSQYLREKYGALYGLRTGG